MTRRLAELVATGWPVLVSLSNKDFVGEALGRAARGAAARHAGGDRGLRVAGRDACSAPTTSPRPGRCSTWSPRSAAPGRPCAPCGAWRDRRSRSVCPHPPLLLPGATGRPVAEVEPLRAACARRGGSAGRGRRDRGDRAAPGTGRYRADWPPPPGTSLPGRPANPSEVLPLSLAVGGGLLAARTARGPPVELWGIADDADPGTSAGARGRSWPPGPSGCGLLVLADGSARRGEKAPGYLDDRARPLRRRRSRPRCAPATAGPAGAGHSRWPPSCWWPAGPPGRCWPRPERVSRRRSPGHPS